MKDKAREAFRQEIRQAIREEPDPVVREWARLFLKKAPPAKRARPRRRKTAR